MGPLSGLSLWGCKSAAPLWNREHAIEIKENQNRNNMVCKAPQKQICALFSTVSYSKSHAPGSNYRLSRLINHLLTYVIESLNRPLDS